MKQFTMKAHVYTDTPKFYNWDHEHKYPCYEEIGTVSFGTLPFENLTECAAYLDDICKEHDFYGQTAYQVDENGIAVPNGDFYCACVKGC